MFHLKIWQFILLYWETIFYLYINDDVWNGNISQNNTDSFLDQIIAKSLSSLLYSTGRCFLKIKANSCSAMFARSRLRKYGIYYFFIVFCFSLTDYLDRYIHRNTQNTGWGGDCLLKKNKNNQSINRLTATNKSFYP